MDINPSAKSNRLLWRSARVTAFQRGDKRTRTGNFLASVLHSLLTTNSTNVSKSALFLSFCSHRGAWQGLAHRLLEALWALRSTRAWRVLGGLNHDLVNPAA